jgi:transcriptional regulator of arginine metabolism
LTSPRLKQKTPSNAVQGALPRRAAIRRIIRTQRVSTQEALADRLAAEGFEVTQATLSRDLAKLRAVRVSVPGGGMAYELETWPAAGGENEMREMGQGVISVNDNGSLVVVLTHPGSAPAVARAIDLLRLPETLGSLAGDDTIFVAPSRKSSADALAQKLKALFGKGEP